jgi:hypothetical protein
MSSQHSFREVRWLQAGSPGAVAAAAPMLLLLDPGRNYAIAIPVSVPSASASASGSGSAPSLCAALICLTGLHGDFCPFHSGAWCTQHTV